MKQVTYTDGLIEKLEKAAGVEGVPLTDEQLAKKLGVSTQTIRRAKKRCAPARIVLTAAICEKFDMYPSEVLTITKTNTEKAA